MGESLKMSISGGAQGRAPGAPLAHDIGVRPFDAVEAWSRFVAARDRYHSLATDPKADPAALAAARAAIQEAYLSWSSH
ncbi:MAG: hypothetical protein U1E97_04445 [Alphaproteobacteria bacterium]